MKKLIIGLTDSEELGMMIALIKSFLISKTEYEISIVASKDKALSLSTQERCNIIDTSKEDILDTCFQILKEDKDIDEMIAFGDEMAIIQRAEEVLEKKDEICLVEKMSSLLTGRKFITSFPLDEKKKDYNLLYKACREYLEETEGKDDPTFAIYSAKKEEISFDTKAFKGIKELSELVDVKEDIALFDRKEYEVFLKGVETGEKLVENYIEVESSNSSFNYKLGSFFMKGVFKNYQSKKERLKRSGIATLVGFSKKIMISPEVLSASSLKLALESL